MKFSGDATDVTALVKYAESLERDLDRSQEASATARAALGAQLQQTRAAVNGAKIAADNVLKIIEDLTARCEAYSLVLWTAANSPGFDETAVRKVLTFEVTELLVALRGQPCPVPPKPKEAS
jgi:hypothetical protein